MLPAAKIPNKQESRPSFSPRQVYFGYSDGDGGTV